MSRYPLIRAQQLVHPGLVPLSVFPQEVAIVRLALLPPGEGRVMELAAKEIGDFQKRQP